MIDKLIKALDNDLKTDNKEDAAVALHLLKSLGVSHKEIAKRLVELNK